MAMEGRCRNREALHWPRRTDRSTPPRESVTVAFLWVTDPCGPLIPNVKNRNLGCQRERLTEKLTACRHTHDPDALGTDGSAGTARVKPRAVAAWPSHRVP